MAASYLSLDALAPAFAANALVLVPNNRLRNHLLRAYALQQQTQAWLKPDIQTLGQWLSSQWEQLQDHSLSYACVSIASPLQRQIAWESAIKNSTLGASLLQPKALAQQVDTAFKNLELWRLGTELLDDYFTDAKSNSAQYASWAKEFNRMLALQNCTTTENTYELIARAFIQGDLKPLEKIYLEGFDDLPPLMQHVLEVASKKLIRLPNQCAVTSTLIRTQAETAEEEIRAAALWSKQQLQQKPEAVLIGIVVPNLGQSRDQVERIFTEVFEPHALLPYASRYTLPFNFSAGTPLGATPLIHSLFEILNLQEKERPFEDLCNLLYSPFWGDEENEALVRTHLMAELRKSGRITLGIGDLHHMARKLEAAIPVFAGIGLSARFESLANLLRRRFGNKSASEWLTTFDAILATLNWPGTRRLDSQEYQQLNQWFEVRDEFMRLDNHVTSLSYTQACRYLRELADKTPFQAQTPDSPIQILGALEAAGLQFSHLWVMGLDDNQWPPAPAPNPLLPLELQRKHNMPHASAARELEIAQGLMQRYKQSAQHIVFSSARHNADNELRPSTLIRDIPLTDLGMLLQPQSDLQIHYQKVQSSAQLDMIQDSQGPRLDEDEPVRGGSSLFKYQAVCPFEAFVRLRLGAKNPDEPVIGFNAAERGNLLHDSLAAIWRELKNSAGLAVHDSLSLEKLVGQITASIVTQARARSPGKVGQVYCDLEQKRLTVLLCEWLANERERPAFSVMAIEQDKDIQFAGLTLRLRIDRIDEFTNGDRLLIDYKTGNASAKSWQGERITEPQLPLYAVTGENIAAISFAQINRKQQKWDGLGSLSGESVNQPGIQSSDEWQLQLQQWREQLQQLADDFINGDARIDFKDTTLEKYAQDLAPLTRIADAASIAALSAKEAN